MKIREAALYIIVLGFVLGIFIDELAQGGRYIFVAAITVSIVVASLAGFFRGHKVLLFVFLTIASAGLGFSRNYVFLLLTNRHTEIDVFVNEKIAFSGVILEEQERRDFNTRLTIGILEINNKKVNSKIKILVTTASPKDFKYGDLVRVRGELILPENFYTDTGREFDYVGYLRANRIKFLMRNASVEVSGYDPPSRLLSTLFFAKRNFVNSLSNTLPEPQSSLAAGILIDGKQSINGDLQEKFRKTGLVHIVVLSGYNVSIVAEAIGRAFSFLPRMVGFLGASFGIIAFALVTGASATVVRASIMALIVIASRMSLRNYDPCRGLFIASFLMLVHNPAILFHSPSFQLSFLATFVVIKIVPIFAVYATFLPERFGFRDLVVSNIVVQIFLFPILSWMTGFVSIVSLPVNLLVLPLIPVTMLVSFLTALTGLTFTIVALPFAFTSHMLLSYELMVVDFFSKFSLAEIPVSGFSSWSIVAFYVVTIIFSLFFVRTSASHDRLDVKK